MSAGRTTPHQSQCRMPSNLTTPTWRTGTQTAAARTNTSLQLGSWLFDKSTTKLTGFHLPTSSLTLAALKGVPWFPCHTHYSNTTAHLITWATVLWGDISGGPVQGDQPLPHQCRKYKGAGRGLRRSHTASTLLTGGAPMEMVEGFKYLGVRISR